MRFIETFEESTKKRLFVPDPVVYISSEKQEELIRSGRYRPTATTPTETQPEIVVFDKVIYFSDDGSKIAYYQRTTLGKRLRFYSINYTNNTKTFIKEINITSLEFSGKNTEKCLISNDGKYAVLSVPSERSVYFYDIVSGSLLQTITDDQPNFGILIASDENLYTMVITTNQLRREPNEYDVRATAFSASSVAHYYKRNFRSTSTQSFRRIHSKESKNLIVDNASFLNYFFTGAVSDPSGVLGIFANPLSSFYISHFVSSYSDLYCKKGVYNLTSVSLYDDLIDYNCFTNNSNSIKYSSVDISRDKLVDSYYFNSYYYSSLFETFIESLPNKYCIEGSSSYFRILKNDDSTEDYSYLSIWPNFSIYNKSIELGYDNATARESISTSPTFFEKQKTKMLKSTAPLDSGSSFVNNQFFTFNTAKTISIKTALNDDHIYNVEENYTNNVKNFQFFRYDIYNKNLTEIFFFPQTTNTEEFDDYSHMGMVKIMFSNEERGNLEEGMNIINYSTGYEADISTEFLQNPSSCGECEFAFSVENAIMNQNIKNIYASNKHLFLNLSTNTLVFEILNDTCKSLQYIGLLNTLEAYNFFYNDNVSYFSIDDIVYKFEEQSLLLTKIIEV